MAFDDAPVGTTLAIVPDAKDGWKALFPRAKQYQRGQVPQQRIDQIHAELHQLYALED